MIASMKKGLLGATSWTMADLDAREVRQVLDLAHEIKKARRWPRRPLDGRPHRNALPEAIAAPGCPSKWRREAGGPHHPSRSRTCSWGSEKRRRCGPVLDRYVDGVVARLRSHADLLELAASSTKPVIQRPHRPFASVPGPRGPRHPREVKGDLSRQHLVYIGDGNNIVASLIEASALAGFALTVITPPGYQPRTDVVERARSISPGKLRSR